MIQARNLPSGLTRLVAMSCSLDDRLAGMRTRGARAGAGEGEESAAARFATWSELVAPASPASFAERLAWDSLDEVEARRLVYPAAFETADAVAFPAWAGLFESVYGSTATELAASFAAQADHAPDPVLDPADPIAFETLFLPAVDHARRELRARTGPNYRRLSRGAHTTLERQLLGRLSYICERALYTEFSIFRQMGQLTAVSGSLGGAPSRVLYEAFVQRMARGGLFEFFQQYSVAARLCATVTGSWIEATADFITRLAADLPRLGELFNRGTPLGRVARVRVGQGDAHDGGRCVAIVEFRAGPRIVYKPRPLVLEGLYAELVDWLNGHEELTLELRYPRRLERETHGWAEFIEHRACSTIEDVRRFYRRTGMVLALVYGIDGTDFHFENLIAHGEHPVLIDMEALLSHRLSIEGSVNDRSVGSVRAATELVRASVVRTGLLPVLKFSSDGRQAINMGGLASEEDAGALKKIAYWRHINTDLMKLASRPGTLPATDNAPVHASRPHFASDHVDAIVDGFREVYALLVKRRGELVGADGILAKWGTRPVRFIFRHTSLYGAALARTVDPKYLRDGALRFIQLDALAKPLLVLGQRPGLPRLLAAERAALERMDIPMFVADAGSRTLDLPCGDRIDGFFDGSALEATSERLAGLSDADLALQVDLIRMGLQACSAKGLQPPSARRDRGRSDAGDPRDLRASAIDEAKRIAEVLHTRALTRPGDWAWIGIRSLPHARRHVVGPLDESFFDGYSGIAFFLAALAHTTGSDRYRDAALSALFPLRERLAQLGGAGSAPVGGIGVGHGPVSAIYALVHIASFVDEPALLAEARTLADLVTPEAVSAATPDVLTGSAGAILALLPLSEATGEAGLLERAVSCGQRLGGQWRSVEALEPGLPFGAAGVALALYRLHAQTGDTDFRDSAATALDQAERGFAAANAASEHRPGDWARGLTGLAFAQLAAGRKSVRRTALDATLTRIAADPLDAEDSLCSGRMGHADLLATAALELGRPELLQRARALGRRVLAQGWQTGWGPGYEHLGLFQGAPGVGYGLLRLAAPDALPSVLGWDPCPPKPIPGSPLPSTATTATEGRLA